MKLYEYEAKEIFARYGLPIPRGRVIQEPKMAADVISEIGGPVVIKPQLGVKGRGKARAILFASNPQEAIEYCKPILGKSIMGEKVEMLLIEEKVEVSSELYLAVTVDYSVAKPVIIASSSGGVDIEEVSRERGESIRKIPISISRGILEEDLDSLTSIFNAFDSSVQIQIRQFSSMLYQIFRDYDAEIAEINPLALARNDSVIALDAVLNIDEDSLFRHPELIKRRGKSEKDFQLEELCREMSWTYIEMDGDIGILSSGAGLTMAILDLIQQRGGSAANFLDTAQMDADGIYKAFELFYQNPKVKVILVNIFAGLNRCDNLAEGIKRYLRDHQLTVPLVVRMIGNREEEGRNILKQINVEAIQGLEEAVDKVVDISRNYGENP
jgi:succinyl-CoA synthetase beta subunit